MPRLQLWGVCVLLVARVVTLCASSSFIRQADVRQIAVDLYEKGKLAELITYLNEVEAQFNTLSLDTLQPSLYAYKGVALYNAQNLEEAETSFKAAVSYYPYDTRSWINLGELRVQTFNINGAIMAFEQAYSRGDTHALGYLMRAKGWATSWQHFELYSSVLEKSASRCLEAQNEYAKGSDEMIEACAGLGGSNGLEYTSLRGEYHLVGHAMSPNVQFEHRKALPAAERALVGKKEPNSRLKVGVVSADFGVHPVSSLIRGAIQMLNKEIIELYCISLQPKVSWWGLNISETAEHFLHLPQVNSYEAARVVAGLGIEVLIDLNGHTQFSGLRVMAHKPAPVQVSFLGLPASTGSTFIDYYLGDRVALPPEHASHFSESVALLPECYIVNDYAQLQGDLVDSLSLQRANRSALGADVDLQGASIVFATLSNTQKWDPVTFHVWMNIMRTFAGSKFVHIAHKGSDVAQPHLRAAAAAQGIHSSSVGMAPQSPWIDHLYIKTAADVILDTVAKNGHTTGLDGIWAGIPTVSLAGGTHMSARAAESIHSSLGSELGLAYSLKDYEDGVKRVLSEKGGARAGSQGGTVDVDKDERRRQQGTQSRLQGWREDNQRRRVRSALFDTRAWTRDWERQIQLTWDLQQLGVKSAEGKQFHIVVGQTNGEKGKSVSEGGRDKGKGQRVPTHQVYTAESEYFSPRDGLARRGPGATVVTGKAVSPQQSAAITGAKEKEYKSKKEGDMEPLPEGMLDRNYLFLNIGGLETKQGWYNVNSQRRVGIADNSPLLTTVEADEHGRRWRLADVDVIRLMDNLVGIPDGAVSAIYGSHILEHASFGDGHLERTLREWHRVLRPGGLLMVSVPDLMILFQLYIKESMSKEDRWLLTRVIYGAQSDEFDYHKVGFDFGVLRALLHQNGYCDIERVGSFNLFNDSSEIAMFGRKISLNVAAKKCKLQPDAFNIDHSASPYRQTDY